MPFPVNPVHRLLLEDGVSFLLLEDNTSKLVLDEQIALDDPLNAATVSTVTPGLTFAGESLSAVSDVQAIPLTTKMGNAQQTSYTTTSISPAPNNLILLWVYSIAASTPNTPTATGNGLTWVQVATVGDGSGLRTLTLFRAMGTSPTIGAVTIDFSAQTQQGAGWSIVQYNNVNTGDTDGSAAIIQNITGNTAGASTGSLSLTLANFVSTMNATAGGFGIPLNTAALPAVGGSFVATGQDNQASTNTAIGSEFLSTNSTSVSMSSPGASIPWTGIAVEISANPTLTYEIEVDTVNTFDSTQVSTVSTTTAYYFDASDGGPTDPNAVWNNDANAFDNDSGPTTSAGTSTAGSSASNFLRGDGTNAPISGGNITAVNFRFNHQQTGSTFPTDTVQIYTAALAELLGSKSQATGPSQTWTNLTALSIPSGGWTWQKVNNLVAVAFMDAGGSASPSFGLYKIEIQVTYDAPVLGPLLDKTSDLNTGFVDDTTTALGDDRLLLEDSVSHLLLEDSASKLAINYDYPSDDYVTYTVPASVLSNGTTYYWRARQKVQNGGSYTGWSEIRSFTPTTGLTTPQTQQGKARIQYTTPQNVLGKSRIQLVTSQTQLGKSRITISTPQTTLGKARIAIISTRTQTGIARIQITSTKTQLGKARIALITGQTILGKARIQLVTSQTILGKSRITASTTQTQPGKARITATTTQNQLGKASIAKATNQTQQGLARVTATTSKAQLGKGDIKKVTTQTQLGLSRITIASTQTILGKARITAATPQTQLGKADINNTTLRAQQGKARITNTSTQATTGKARISTTSTQLQLGKSRITISTPQTTLGKARITVTTPQTIAGKARITTTITTTQTQLGAARITATTAKTITGKARVQITSVQTQTGKANIRASLDYTYGGYGSLPAGNSDLTTSYTPTQITNVSTLGNTTDVVDQANTTYRAHQFSVHFLTQAAMTIQWIGKIGQPSSVRNVVLQVYNLNSATWETLTADSGSATGAAITLNGTVSASLSNYFDSANFIYFRVYQ